MASLLLWCQLRRQRWRHRSRLQRNKRRLPLQRNKRRLPLQRNKRRLPLHRNKRRLPLPLLLQLPRFQLPRPLKHRGPSTTKNPHHRQLPNQLPFSPPPRRPRVAVVVAQTWFVLSSRNKVSLLAQARRHNLLAKQLHRPPPAPRQRPPPVARHWQMFGVNARPQPKQPEHQRAIQLSKLQLRPGVNVKLLPNLVPKPHLLPRKLPLLRPSPLRSQPRANQPRLCPPLLKQRPKSHLCRRLHRPNRRRL